MEPKAEQKESKYGQAAVAGGAVSIKGPEEEGAPGALLLPGAGITLLVNGVVAEGGCRVLPGDTVLINPVEYNEPFQIEVRISDDAMTAAARFIPAKSITHEIVEQPFAPAITVEGLRRETIAPGGTEDDIRDALAREGVVFGVEGEALKKVLNEPGAWHTVAEGLPPAEGRHGYAEPLFAGELKLVRYDHDQERVDYRERYEIEQVEPGDVIAAIYPPVPGTPGRTVTGRPLDPPQVFPATVRCGTGAAIHAGGQVVATRKGVPGFKAGREYRLQVDDLYIHRGDIDIRSGNANFRGHLEIKGDIAEGMKVTAEGDIVVNGSSAGATVLAGGSIIFKNQCIKCRVRAGWKETILLETYEVMEKLCAALENALCAADDLAFALHQKGAYSEKSEAALVRALMQSKFISIPELAADLLDRVKKNMAILPDELIRTVGDRVAHLVDFNYSQSLGRPVLAQVYAVLQARIEEKIESETGACITAPYVQNSDLTCTGDIIVTGSGVYNSRFRCGGSVRIKKVFRGGSIEAGDEVQIGEAGSPRQAGDQGLVIVPKKGAVLCGRAYEGFRVIFGQWEYRLNEVLSNVRLRFDAAEYTVKLEPLRSVK